MLVAIDAHKTVDRVHLKYYDFVYKFFRVTHDDLNSKQTKSLISCLLVEYYDVHFVHSQKKFKIQSEKKRNMRKEQAIAIFYRFLFCCNLIERTHTHTEKFSNILNGMI